MIAFVQAWPLPSSLQLSRTRSPAGASFGFSPQALDWNLKAKGVCPGCGLQWPLTQCPQCGQVSPHRQWYREPEGSEADRVREVELTGT